MNAFHALVIVITGLIVGLALFAVLAAFVHFCAVGKGLLGAVLVRWFMFVFVAVISAGYGVDAARWAARQLSPENDLSDESNSTDE